MDIEHDLTTKIGPAPLWVYAAGAGVFYLIYEHFIAPTPSTPVAAARARATKAAPLHRRMVPRQGVAVGNRPTSTYTTNQQWGLAAIRTLEAEGVSGGDATTAVYRYLRGEWLGAPGARLITQAINAIGPPPDIRPISKGGRNGAK